MSRNGSGVYSLPSGNPVVSGTSITSTWANNTLSDVATELTNSLPRDGQAPMTAPLKLADGVVGAPSLSFNSEPSTGLYRIGASQLGVAVGGTAAVSFTATGPKLIDGAVSTPSLAFSSETNTGLYRIGANQLGITVGGTSAASVTATGPKLIDGSASAPSLAFSSETNTGLYRIGTNQLGVAVNGALKLTLNATGGSLAGNLDFSGTGRRITADFSNATVASRAILQTSTTNGPTFVAAMPNGSSTTSGFMSLGGTDPDNTSYLVTYSGALAIIEAGKTGAGSFLPMVFYAGGSERMRITTAGNVLVGRTTAYADGAIGTPTFQVNSVTGAAAGMVMFATTTTATAQIGFANGNGTVGAISTSGSATTYGTSSDYRLKENIKPMKGALDSIMRLRPVTYSWKIDGASGEGFIAHELQEDGAGNCVTGTKDAVDADGKPVYQGIDTSGLIGRLVAAMQEQQALISDLVARLLKLETAQGI